MAAYIDVTSSPYSAVGDGVTDDTTAIASALAALPAAGGVLFFPANHTFLVQHIDIAAFSGNLVLMGGGWSSVIKLKNGANDWIIKNTTGAQQGTTICNLKLDCNSANQTGASGGIYGYKYRRCLLDFVWIHNPWQAGILLIGDVGDFGYQNRISNCFIEGGMNTTSGVNAYGNGLRLVNTDENEIYANHFENNGNPNDATFGFHIYDQNGLNNFSFNSFVNGMGVMKFDGLQNRVIGNAFDGNGGNAVQINSTASATIVKNNTLINIGYRASGGSANSVNGIYLNATECIIEGNYFQSDASATPKTNSFVRIDTGATYCLVQNNELNVQASSGTLSGAIIFVAGNPTGCRVRNNVGFDNVNSKAIFVTENHGTASITTGTTSVVVNHGLAMTPTLEQISVTPQSSLGSAHFYWIDTVTSTQFTIHTDANPAGTVNFGWIANTGW